MTFEPQILSFLCNWCAYAGADLAGISRFQYPPNTRVIRVMCSGRVDPIFIPKAFLAGFDGVMVLGCHPGDCHYLTGNFQAEQKINLTQKVFEMAGMGSERILLDWVSAGEGERFAQVVRQFVEKIRSQGPFSLDEEKKGKLLAIKASLEGEKISWMVGKGPELLEKENVYLREEIKLKHQYKEIIGQSEAIKQVLNQVEQVAGMNSTVLIMGETGTGKELVAQAIHGKSNRRYFPIISINCGAFPEGLLESELFGHEKGAFTGAQYKRKGKMEMANGGTLFFD
jgi:F420-non-reducing hydrogenase iron-sulfur subunit